MSSILSNSPVIKKANGYLNLMRTGNHDSIYTEYFKQIGIDSIYLECEIDKIFRDLGTITEYKIAKVKPFPFFGSNETKLTYDVLFSKGGYYWAFLDIVKDSNNNLGLDGNIDFVPNTKNQIRNKSYAIRRIIDNHFFYNEKNGYYRDETNYQCNPNE